MSAPRVPASDRFWPKVQKTDTCWLWTAAKNSSGYGTFSGDRQPDGTKPRLYAHRWAYETLRGPIPDGLHLDHLCRVRNCVRPDHLEPVTNRVNILRGTSFSARNAKKTHCPRGHELAGENLVAAALRRGDRNCKTCAQERERIRCLTRTRRKTATATR